MAFDVDKQKPKIYSLDEIDYAIFQSVFNKKSKNELIDRIIKNAIDLSNKKDIKMFLLNRLILSK